MFAPMTPMTERVRIQNERALAQHQNTAFALPKMNVTAPLRKLLSVRRPVAQDQSPAPADAVGCC
ncbi:MAG: hypothetical protein HY866_00715 [Chloroflexi bacterium]|nr:hypothetical protein [Chloroflexota bacterium]